MSDIRVLLSEENDRLIDELTTLRAVNDALSEQMMTMIDNAGKVAALRAENERLRAALEEHKKAKPDWYWRDLDPDDAGDTIGEALRFMPDNVVCAIRSSFVGPTFFAARVPVLDPESDDTEELCADNEADCLLLVKDRLKARAALAGGQHE